MHQVIRQPLWQTALMEKGCSYVGRIKEIHTLWNGMKLKEPLSNLWGLCNLILPKPGFLAVGDECIVKFSDMDNVNLLATTDAEGGLLASPCSQFNKEGILLAVSTNDNGIKILANTDGIRLLQRVKCRSTDASRIASAAIIKYVQGGCM